MSIVTDIKMVKSRGKRIQVCLDGKFAFSLYADQAVKEGLQNGQELSGERIEALTKADQFYRCLDAANLYLSYRPRSESELRHRLERRGFDSNSIEAVLGKLKEQGLVDDLVFAQFWKDNRESFNPRSLRLTKLELKRKGIKSEIIDQVVEATDDSDSAYRAALGRVRHLPLSDYKTFRRRLGDYLRRRGFSYETIGQTVTRVWQDLSGSRPEP